MYRKQTKMVLHKTFMAITSSPGHKHDRVHKFIKICKVLCKIINLRFIFAIDYTQSKEQHLNQWVKEKDPTSCIILSLLYLSMYFTSQQLFVQVYSKNSSCRPTHILTHSQCNTLSASAVVTVNSGEWNMIWTSTVTMAVQHFNK